MRFVGLANVLHEEPGREPPQDGPAVGFPGIESQVAHTGLPGFLVPDVEGLSIQQDLGVGVEESVLVMMVLPWKVVGEDLPGRGVNGVYEAAA